MVTIQLMEDFEMKKLREDQLALWRSFVNLHATIIRRIEKDLSAHQHVPLTWYDVLVALYQSPGKKLRMSELAKKTILTPSGVTRLVERLEREGYVCRKRTEEDLRGSYAVLTRKGKRAFLQAWTTYEQGIYSYFANRLNEEEQKVIRQAFERIEKKIGRKTDHVLHRFTSVNEFDIL